MQALQHTTVGYKLSATQIGLLSHYNPLYMDSFQQKQSHFMIFLLPLDCFINDRYPVLLEK